MPVLSAALGYHSLGLVVLPVRKGIKSPSLNAWSSEGPQTEARVRELFAAHDGNVGVLCGHASALLVLDIDLKYGKKGDESIDAWEAEHGPLPETFSTTTPSGGYQLWYRTKRRLKSNRKLLKDVDIQCEGAQIVAPPSVLIGEVGANGRPQVPGAYVVLNDVPIADAPKALLDALEQSPDARTTTKAVDWSPVSHNDPTFPERVAMQRAGFKEAPLHLSGEGQGNVRYVMMFQELGPGLLLDAGVTYENYATYYDPRLPPEHRWLPNCEKELRHTIGRAYYRPMREGAQPDDTWQSFSAERELGISFVDAAPSIATPVVEALPSFPLETLPPVLRDFVRAEAEHTQTPPDLAAMLVLGCCAATVAGKYDVEVERGYVEPLNLFTVTALPPGERKSAVVSAVFAPLEAAEQWLVESSVVTRAMAESKLEQAKTELADLKKQYAKLKAEDLNQEWSGPRDQGGTALERQIAEQAGRVDALEAPVVPRLLCDDVTPERLAVLMAEQGGRMCLKSAEGTIFQVIAGRYSKDGKASFEVFLQGHAGDTLRVDRQSRPSVYVRHPRLTMALAIQPSVIQSLGTNEAMRGQGLLARFLYSLPQSRIGSRQPISPPMPDDVERRYHDCIRRLAELPTPEDQKIPRLQLDPAALTLHRELRARIEPRLVADLQDIRDWANKLAGAVARIAAILSIVANGHERPVSAEAMAAAIRLGEHYLLPHAANAFGAILTTKTQVDGEAIMVWIERAKLGQFKMRDLKRCGPRGLRGDKFRTQAALQDLVDQGRLAVVAPNEWRVDLA